MSVSDARPTVPSQAGPLDAEAVLAFLGKRFSCREFDASAMDRDVVEAIIEDGLQAPSSCNQQNWHFIAVSDPEMKKRAREISGGNHHFEYCSVLIYLCFQKGWTHDKFSIVQSVAAACYHMMLSAHLRGFSSIWNAGIGDTKAIAALLDVPPTFEIQGALCIGTRKPTAPAMKAPRRPIGEVWSWNRFDRPGKAVYPAKPAASYPYFKISNARNPYAEWRPSVWGWERIADFRGYSVWAKSPISGVYQSRRQGEATAIEVGLLGDMKPGSHVVDIMPWGGTHTAELVKWLDRDVLLSVAELAQPNLTFIQERLRQEVGERPVRSILMSGPRIPLSDASVEGACLFQVLEHVPDPAALLDEVHRILKPGGHAVISVRNLMSLHGLQYFREISKQSVPNQGPFVPLVARTIRAWIAKRFSIEREIGISLKAESDAAIHEGVLSRYCRVYALRVVKR